MPRRIGSSISVGNSYGRMVEVKRDFSDIHISTADYDWSSSSFNSYLIDWFRNHSPEKNCYSTQIEINVRVSISEFFERLNDLVQPDTYMWFTPSTFVLQAGSVLIYCSGRDRGDLQNTRVVNYFTIEMWGEKSRLDELQPRIKSTFERHSYAQVNWFYRGQHGIESRSIFVDNNKMIKNEFYPWFKDGVDSFLTDYLASEAMVLLLYGPPGTGKTSFIKYLLTKHKLQASITYDDKILGEDHFFIDFLTDDAQDTLVIEDADVLLTDRERDHNSIMSKFLNVSDGIVKIPGKKMIFTTNITQLNTVDEALLRKGRCYAAIEFRRLNQQEAAIAANSAGIENFNERRKDTWSLADLFNDEDVPAVEAPVRTQFGFVVR